MGEVYRARDRKLDRDVAVKVLPQSVAADPEALARFEREAKAVAALSHPNILSIFDFGTQDGIAYAVMELLEGETLRGKLDAGHISQKQAVDCALQIAHGLAAAHEILKEEPPDLSLSRSGVSPALDHVVRHCLEKDRDNRFQTAKDIVFALSEASGPTAATGVQLSQPPTGTRKVLIAAAVTVVLAVAGVFVFRRSQGGAGQVQSDIATRVAEKLGVALGASDERRLPEKPTQNLAAYDAFLKGEEARGFRDGSVRWPAASRLIHIDFAGRF
jgi:hypothetical protein